MPRTCPTCRGLGVVPDVTELPTDAALRAAADDAPTAKLPPIRDSIGPRRRPPALAELTDRADLIEAMQAELRRELRELREDQADEDDL